MRPPESAFRRECHGFVAVSSQNVAYSGWMTNPARRVLEPHATRHPGRVFVALAAVTVSSIALLVAPASPSFAAGPVVCTSTGGNSTTTATIGGIRYNIVSFTSGGTFTPAQATRADYLVVGGGGGGGGSIRRVAGGGGGGGEVLSGSVAIPASAQTITIGTGGTAGTTSTSRGGTGVASSIAALVVAQGGTGGGAGVTNLTGVAATSGASAGGGGGAASGTVTGGTATAPGFAGGNGITSGTTTNPSGGGGGGQGAIGTNATLANGGAGGAGLPSLITGTSVTRAGGGGGGGNATGGAGANGGGAGGTSAARTGGTATANTGSGGGGAGNGTVNSNQSGGAGGSGIVIIRYPRYCLNISPPTSVSFSSPTMSWAAPLYLPSGQTVASYTVAYRRSTDTTAGNIYARSTSGTSLSINVTGVSQGACNTNNPSGWTCNAGITLTSGETYEFRVFAKSSTGTFGQQAAAITYAVP